MGAALSRDSKKADGERVAQQRALSGPVVSFRHTAKLTRDTLQDVCVAVIADALASNRVMDVSVLPIDLIQRVVDALVQTGERAREREREIVSCAPFLSGCFLLGPPPPTPRETGVGDTLWSSVWDTH
jgi:hypothetical protein